MLSLPRNPIAIAFGDVVRLLEAMLGNRARFLVSVSLGVASTLATLSTNAFPQSSGHVRDSAGVRIVEHAEISGIRAPLTIEVRSTLELDVVRGDASEELDPRRPYLAATRLSDGRWIAVDWNSLKVYDALGRFVRRVGRGGGGPGEFYQLRDVCVVRGDTIIGFSLSDRRYSVFDSSGRHVLSGKTSGEIRQDPCFADGSFAVRGVPQPNPKTSLTRSLATMLDRVAPVDRVHWNGATVRSLGLLQVEGTDQTFEDFSNIAVRDGRIHVGNGSEAEYRVYSAAGRLRQIVRWTARLEPITREMRETAIRRGFLQGPANRTHLPVYWALRVGPAGSVWVQAYAAKKGEPTTFTLFGGEGQLIGRIELSFGASGRVDVPWIGEHQVLLSWREENGTPHLSLHRLLTP